LTSFRVFLWKEAVIIDINKDLINTYKAVRDHVDCLIGLLQDIEQVSCARYEGLGRKCTTAVRKGI
jgi:site-specific DNA-adenine methylase